MAIATFAAGCFWKPQHEFDKLDGVTDSTVGYTGGTVEDPTYEQVCTGRTGHAEAVRVEYDPERISFEELLRQFWMMHDPTQKDRQGPDVGTQYRSAVFYHTPEQKQAAEESRERRDALEDRPIVTEIAPAGTFYPAEDYHQDYYEKRSGAGGGGLFARWL